MSGRVRLYAAVSLDGCLADAKGGVGWLAPFEAQDYGLDGFLAQVGSVLTGRTTYDQARGFGDWPYAGKRVVVMTRRALDPDPPAGVEVASGDILPVLARLRAETPGDIWLLGGAALAQRCLAAGLVDSLELFLMPVTLGSGLRLFSGGGPSRRWSLTAATPYPKGVVAVAYHAA